MALHRGYPYARVDTSPDSRPILIRLGLKAVADTRPYVLDPSAVAGEASSATSLKRPPAGPPDAVTAPTAG